MSFPKYVFDFIESGMNVGDRLTIDPWSFTFVSDTSENLLLPQPGDKFIRGESALMLIRVQSDADVPEPASVILISIGIIAGLGFFFARKNTVFSRDPKMS